MSSQIEMEQKFNFQSGAAAPHSATLPRILWAIELREVLPGLKAH